MLTDRSGPPEEPRVEAGERTRDVKSSPAEQSWIAATTTTRSERAALQDYVARRWWSTFTLRAIVASRILLAGCAALIVATLAIGPALPPTEYTVLVALCLLQIATIVGTRRSGSPQKARRLMLAFACADCVLVSVAAAIGGRTITAVAFGAVCPMGCAAVLPWRPRDQTLLAAVAMAVTVGNGYVVNGTLGLAGDGVTVMVMEALILVASVYITYELERTRLAGAAEEMTRIRADHGLLELNSELERRVAVRTRELETRTRDLERVVKELQAMSYTVSHDLRQPLRHINGYGTALRQEYAEVLDARARGYIDSICAATQRMGGMIDSMLRLGRVTRAELTREAVNLSAIVRNIAASVRAASPERTVRWIVQDDVWGSGDESLLRVALENLLDNALKFSRDSDPTYVEFGMDDGGGEAVYYVRDNGVGFDMRYYDKLFGLFTRLHGQQEFEGAGIGLATVQRAIERHGGRVWAHSAVSKGTTFFFTLG